MKVRLIKFKTVMEKKPARTLLKNKNLDRVVFAKKCTREERATFEAYRKAADKGDVRAQYLVAWCLELGAGTDVNELRAREYLKLAAEQNDSDAQCRLGFHFFEEKNYLSAIPYFKKAASYNASALEYLGHCYSNGYGVDEDKKYGNALYRRSAEKGNAWAYAYAADSILKDKDAKENDINLAIEWLKKCEKRNHNKSTYLLAECYRKGLGVEKNEKLAHSLLEKAAKLGYSDACNMLAEEHIDLFKIDKKIQHLDGALIWLQRSYDNMAENKVLKSLSDLYQAEAANASGRMANELSKKVKECGDLRIREPFKQNVMIRIGRNCNFTIPIESYLTTQKKLKQIHLEQIEAAVATDKYAKTILYLIKEIGLTIDVTDLIDLWQMLETRGPSIHEQMDEQIKDCLKRYGLTPLFFEEDIKPVHIKAKPKTKSIDPIEFVETALDRGDAKKVEKLITSLELSTFSDEQRARVENIRHVLKLRSEQSEDKVITDNNIEAELIKINKKIHDEKETIYYAERAVQYILKKDWPAARRDLFENIKLSDQVSHPFIAAAINIMRAFQSDTKRALQNVEAAMLVFKSPDLEVALAIIQLKINHFEDAIERIKKFNGAEDHLRKIFINTVLEYLHSLKNPQQILAGIKAISKQGLNCGKLTRLLQALSVPEADPKPVPVESVEPKLKKKKKKSKNLDKGDAKAVVSIPKNEDHQEKIKLVLDSLCLGSSLAEESLDEKKVISPDLLQYSLPEEADRVVQLIQKITQKSVWIAGSINRDRVEVVSGRKKESAPMKDVDIVTEEMLSATELRTICQEAKLPEPYSPKNNLIQLRFPDGMKIDIRCDKELFADPKIGILKRDFSCNALMAVRHTDKNCYQIIDPSGKGIDDICQGVVSPLISPSEWPKKAVEELESGYWVRILRWVKLLSSDCAYQMKSSDVPDFVDVLTQLKTALKDTVIAGHFESHLRKLFVNGQAEMHFNKMIDLGLVKEVFPFLEKVDLRKMSPNYQFIVKRLKEVDQMHVLHKEDSRKPSPSVRYVYAMFMALSLHQKAAPSLSLYLNSLAHDKGDFAKNLYQKANTYFVQTMQKSDGLFQMYNQLIAHTPLFHREFSHCKSNGNEWAIRHECYFRLQEAVATGEISFGLNKSSANGNKFFDRSYKSATVLDTYCQTTHLVEMGK